MVFIIYLRIFLKIILMNRIGGIIFARMNSSRLPGKAMVEINGVSLIERVIEKAKQISKIDHLCVATSIDKEDDIIASFSKSKNVDIYRGSLSDVAIRALEACEEFNYDSFLRICGDRPFFDISIYDKLIEIHNIESNDITTNIFPRTVPPGLSGEVISTNSLKLAIEKSNNAEHREHITKYFYENPNFFKIRNVQNDSISKEKVASRLVIDNLQDLKRATWIDKKINNKDINADYNQIIDLAFEWENNNNNNKYDNIRNT